MLTPVQGREMNKNASTVSGMRTPGDIANTSADGG